MLKQKKHITSSYPPEIAVTLDDLMRYEWLVQTGKLLPSHPVYSILAGRHSSKLRGRGLDFEEVRPYIPGDDIRNIDWRVTARTGKTHSKVFTEEKERPTFILLDQTSWMFFGSTRFAKSVSAAQAAALGAFYTIKRGDRTGGIIFNEKGYDYVPPRRNKQSLEYYLECIVKRNTELPQRIEISPNTEFLNHYLRQTLSLVTHDYVITVISDFSMINSETKELLQTMSYHNDVILIHIYDSFDESLPDGMLPLSDGKRQISWNNNTKSWGAKYIKDFQANQISLTEEFRHTRIPIVFFNTSIPIEDQIAQALGKTIK